jgi:hypothetical protein
MASGFGVATSIPELLTFTSSAPTWSPASVGAHITATATLQRGAAVGERAHLVGAQGRSGSRRARLGAGVLAHGVAHYNTDGTNVNRIALVMHTTSYGADGFVAACAAWARAS